MRKFCICLILTFCIFSCSVFAMTPTYTNDAKFTRGVSNCCYYVDSTASSYTSNVNSAANNWVDTGYGWNNSSCVYAANHTLRRTPSLTWGIVPGTWHRPW